MTLMTYKRKRSPTLLKFFLDWGFEGAGLLSFWKAITRIDKHRDFKFLH